MNFIERVMRFMTHINIGATLGLAAWMLWSGWQVVTGQLVPKYHVAEVRALMRHAHARAPAPTLVAPTQADATVLPPCHSPEQPPRQAALALKGTDL